MSPRQHETASDSKAIVIALAILVMVTNLFGLGLLLVRAASTVSPTRAEVGSQDR